MVALLQRFRFAAHCLDLGFRVLGFRVLGFQGLGLGFRVWGLAFGFRVQGLVVWPRVEGRLCHIPATKAHSQVIDGEVLEESHHL